jgi:AraC-like DNA-binding protein
MSTTAMAARPPLPYSARITGGTTAGGLAVVQRDYRTRTGQPWSLPGYSVAGSGAFRVEVRAVRAHDAVIMDLGTRGGRFTAASQGQGGDGDRILVNLMQRGVYHLQRPGGRVTVPAGSFLAHDNGQPVTCTADPGTAATILILPAAVLAPLMRGRTAAGPASTTEARVLAAHAAMVSQAAADLSPAGLLGARDALLELVRGTLTRQFDDTEPRLAPALARAAMTIADRRLTDPGLTPSALARELHVSVRTLHRAFAAAGEPVAAYVRRRRLEEARLELAAPARPPTVAEIAARWQFSDHSHFNRAFIKKYGQTPAQFARSQRPA